MHRALLQRAVHTEINSECSHFGTGILLCPGPSTARDTDLANLLPEMPVHLQGYLFLFPILCFHPNGISPPPFLQ